MATKKGKVALEVGAGVLAAAVAAGAGYYFYGDKNAKKHRKAASAWAKGMKRDVMKEARALKRLDQKAIAKIVDRAAAVYQGARSIDRKDLRQAASELKRNWREVSREVKSAARTSRKAVTRAAKKRTAKAKRTIRKATKKARKTGARVTRTAKRSR